jgi:hypothetical protein
LEYAFSVFYSQQLFVFRLDGLFIYVRWHHTIIQWWYMNAT